MQQGITKGDVLQRLAGLSFIVGAILLIVFNALFPRASDPSDVGTVLQKAADNMGLFQVVNLLLAVGIWAFMIGLTGVYRSITTGGAAVWARLGYYGVLVGTTIFTITFAFNGFGLSMVLDDWSSATGANKATLFLIASSLYNVSTGLLSMTIIVYWLALTFVGIGMSLSKVYPMIFGGTIIILGIATVAVVGIPQAFIGINKTLQLIFMVLAILSTVWGLVVGLWIARKAW